jgi:hypothetical protein
MKPATRIAELQQRARTYADNYPNVIDEETREAIYESHLAYLMQQGPGVWMVDDVNVALGLPSTAGLDEEFPLPANFGEGAQDNPEFESAPEGCEICGSLTAAECAVKHPNL